MYLCVLRQWALPFLTKLSRRLDSKSPIGLLVFNGLLPNWRTFSGVPEGVLKSSRANTCEYSFRVRSSLDDACCPSSSISVSPTHPDLVPSRSGMKRHSLLVFRLFSLLGRLTFTQERGHSSIPPRGRL